MTGYIYLSHQSARRKYYARHEYNHQYMEGTFDTMQDAFDWLTKLGAEEVYWTIP